MKKATYTVVLLVSSQLIYAQNGVDNILSSVAKNNKTLAANAQLGEAKKLEYKTGLTPNDPKVGYDYLPGSPAGAGVQQNFDITQSFDFLTAYSAKKSMSNQQIARTDLELNALRQSILLEAKINCLSLIYFNKRHAELSRRVSQVKQLYEGYQTMMKNGEATILDVNKAQLLLFNLKTELALNEIEIRNTTTRLTELNGGIAVILPDTVYPVTSEIPEEAKMDSLIEANDVMIKIYSKDRDISATRQKVAKGMALPKLEAGYHYQTILGQTYQGAHFGLSIPLWQNKNAIKTEKAKMIFSDLKIAEHRNEHFFENRQLYDKYLILKTTLAEYNKIFSTFNNSHLLSKSLKMGQISSIEFFMELSYFYTSYDSFLKAENEYNQAIATLNKYQL